MLCLQVNYKLVVACLMWATICQTTAARWALLVACQKRASDDSSEMDIALDLLSAFSPTASSKISSSSHQSIRGNYNVRIGEKRKNI